jgi:protein SCO1/2
MRPAPAFIALLCAAALAACDQPEGIISAPAPAPARLQPGDTVPDFTFSPHNGPAGNFSSLRPGAVLLTFIFTRCPMMEFCPRMSLKFQETRAALDASPSGPGVTLLSLTLDPEHDTPEALAAYARSFQAPERGWLFARCPPDVLEVLKAQFGVRAAPTGPGGSIEHNLITALVDARGCLQKVWEGNAWSTADILKQLPSPAPAQTAGAAPSGR